MQYRRSFVPGGSFFFTVNLANRSSGVLVKHIHALRNAVRVVKNRHPFLIDAMVILPDHLHAIWTLPANDSNFSKRWMLIKSDFSRHLPRNEHCNKIRGSKGERVIWQRRYWEHAIRDQRDMNRHIDYIHYNPVKHGHVDKASDWPHSSIHKYIRDGLIGSNWGCTSENEENLNFGER